MTLPWYSVLAGLSAMPGPLQPTMWCIAETQRTVVDPAKTEPFSYADVVLCRLLHVRLGRMDHKLDVLNEYPHRWRGADSVESPLQNRGKVWTHFHQATSLDVWGPRWRSRAAATKRQKRRSRHKSHFRSDQSLRTRGTRGYKGGLPPDILMLVTFKLDSVSDLHSGPTGMSTLNTTVSLMLQLRTWLKSGLWEGTCVSPQIWPPHHGAGSPRAVTTSVLSPSMVSGNT